MLRIAEVTVNGERFKIREMSFAQVREYMKKSGELLSRQDSLDNRATADEWALFSLGVVRQAICGDASHFEDEHGKATIDALYTEVLKVSGLRTENPEAEAASILPKREAALVQ